MKSWSLIHLALTLCLTTSAPLGLQADEATHKAAVQELLKVTRADQLLTQSLSPIEAKQQELIAKLTEGKDPESAKAITDRVLKACNEVVISKLSWTSMETHYIGIYMQVFTEEEVRGMTAFYQSPLGQKVMDKTPALMAEIMQMTAQKTGDVMPEIEAVSQKAAEEVTKKKAPAPAPALAAAPGTGI
jgi:uncharacterized protein